MSSGYRLLPNGTNFINHAIFGDKRLESFLLTDFQECLIPIKTGVTITTACFAVQPCFSGKP
jgi:hypothetical protein